MKISTIALSALLAASMDASAQTKATEPDTLKRGKTPQAQITEKLHQSKILEEKKKKPRRKSRKDPCPMCGMG
jgi:DNA repair exonuclease SbcCD ATPase subunit